MIITGVNAYGVYKIITVILILHAWLAHHGVVVAQLWRCESNESCPKVDFRSFLDFLEIFSFDALVFEDFVHSSTLLAHFKFFLISRKFIEFASTFRMNNNRKTMIFYSNNE